MDNFIITVAFLLIGITIKRLPAFSKETGTVLNLFVIYISLPALVLLKVPELIFSRHLLAPALMPWGMLLSSAVVVLFLSKVFGWDKGTTGCLLLLIPLGNTSFIGIPMVKVFFGDKAIPYAVLYDQLGSFLALATYGSLVLALYGLGNTKPSVTDVVKKIVTFPPFIALLLAFFLRFFSYPDVTQNILEMLAATLVPLVMIAVGFQLQLRLNREVVGQLTVGLLIKLIAAPILALVFCRLAGLEGYAVNVSIFEAGMPPMISAGALAIIADLNPQLTAALVGIGLLVSFATLPALYQLII